MSTHAIIAARTETGFKGRFVHWDGYPQNMLPAIERTISQNRKAGLTFFDAKNYFLNNHWSGIYTTKHTPADPQSHDQVWYDENSDIDVEYLYILDDNEVTAYTRVGDEWMALNPVQSIKIKVAH